MQLSDLHYFVLLILVFTSCCAWFKEQAYNPAMVKLASLL